MQRMSVNGLQLYYDRERPETVSLISLTCQKTMGLLHEYWRLTTPSDCRVYIMTSWSGFMFHSAPGPWKLLLLATLPLWAVRARRMWPYVGGWEQRYGNRRAVGVKSPRLLEDAERSLRNKIFIDWESPDEHLQSITCHELTHAFSSHLTLPTWLKEGLAMVNVDRFFSRQTVRAETLEILDHPSGASQFQRTQKLRIEDEEALISLYALGYWLTRYMEETRGGLVKELLSMPASPTAYEEKIATVYGKTTQDFWIEITSTLVSHFSRHRDNHYFSPPIFGETI